MIYHNIYIQNHMNTCIYASTKIGQRNTACLESPCVMVLVSLLVVSYQVVHQILGWFDSRANSRKCSLFAHSSQIYFLEQVRYSCTALVTSMREPFTSYARMLESSNSFVSAIVSQEVILLFQSTSSIFTFSLFTVPCLYPSVFGRLCPFLLVSQVAVILFLIGFLLFGLLILYRFSDWVSHT